MATSTYQLIPDDDENLARYENQRVMVRGRLAADVPQGTGGTAGTTGETGTEIQRDATGSTVAADAPTPRPARRVGQQDRGHLRVARRRADRSGAHANRD